MTAPARSRIDVRSGDVVIVHACKCVLMLDAEEIAGLMRLNRVLWIRALRRGRAFKRAVATGRRASDAGPVEVVSTEAMRSEPENASLPGRLPGDGRKR